MVAQGSTSQASTRSRELTLIELAIFYLYAASKDRNPINSQRYVIRLVGLTNLEAQKGASLNIAAESCINDTMRADKIEKPRVRVVRQDSSS